MGDIVNLRMARKAKKRSEAEALAAANRAAFGRTKGQKQADAIERARMESLLNGAKRDPGNAQ